jgi:hypothetical protein
MKGETPRENENTPLSARSTNLPLGVRRHASYVEGPSHELVPAADLGHKESEPSIAQPAISYRKKIAHAAVKFQEYYIFIGCFVAWWGLATPGGLFFAQGLLWFLLGTPVWNTLGDGVAAAITAPDYFHNAEKSVISATVKKAQAWMNIIFGLPLLQIPTGMATYSALLSASTEKHDVWIDCDKALPSVMWVEISSYAFAFNAWFGASVASRLVQRGHAKSTLEKLLDDRLKKHEAAQDNPAISDEKKERLKNQVMALSYVANQNNVLPDNKTVLQQAALAASPEMQPFYFFVVDYLLQKQAEKIKSNQFKRAADFFCGTAGFFGGLSMQENWFPRTTLWLCCVLYSLTLLLTMVRACCKTVRKNSVVVAAEDEVALSLNTENASPAHRTADVSIALKQFNQFFSSNDLMHPIVRGAQPIECAH